MEWNYLSIPKLQRLHRWSLGMDKQFHSTHYNGCNHLSMLGLKLIHVCKRGHWWSVSMSSSSRGALHCPCDLRPRRLAEVSRPWNGNVAISITFCHWHACVMKISSKWRYFCFRGLVCKIAEILLTAFSNEFLWFLKKLILKALIDNQSASFQIMAWRRIGSKPSPEWYGLVYWSVRPRWVKI